MRRTVFDEDHETFRASCAAFVHQHLVPHVDEFIAAKGISREFWLAAGKQGLLGLGLPEEHGGSDTPDFRFHAVLAEELSKVSASLASCVGIHSDIAAPYVRDLGTEDQKAAWLPGIATGDFVLAIAMTEPGGGSDLAALRTTATPDGDGWLINGSKTFITNGHTADLVITAVRTSHDKGSRGISLFMVQATDVGFSRGRKLDKVGQEESDTSELFYDNVHVSAGRLLGEVNRGFVYMMERLPQERLTCAISNVAHAKQILTETIGYAKQRHAFGQPIGSFQHTKFLLAALVTKIEVAEAYVDAALSAHVRGELSSVEAAKAKLWSSEIQNEVLDDCVQVHGGYGYMNEYRVARAWRDARVSRIWAGTNEIMKELIARDLGL